MKKKHQQPFLKEKNTRRQYGQFAHAYRCLLGLELRLNKS